MIKFNSFRLISTLRALALGATAALFAAPAAHAVTTNSVLYSVPRQIVQGNMPLTTSYTLQITSPVYFPVGVVSQVALNTTVLTSPPNVTNAKALSFVTYTPLQTGLIGGLVGSIPLLNQIASAVPVLTFTGPNQTISVTVNVNIPDGAWAGSFGYEISTGGWPSMLTPKGLPAAVDDQGAFINVTAARIASPNGPIISINQPVDQTVYTWVAGGPAVDIPYVLVGTTQDGSPLTAMNATISYTDPTGNVVTQDLGVTPNGLGVPNTNVTATGTFSASTPGIYTINANDANAVGTATAAVQITVQVVSGPPTVSIDTPDPGSTYITTPGNSVTVPFSFTGTSQYSGVRTLTATFDGQPIAITTNGIGNLVATGAANLVLSTAGDHVIAVTCTDDFGTATTNETITLTVQAPNPPPTVVINTPAPNATYTYTTGGAALVVPFTFTGSSTGGPITALTATMDGVPVTFTSAGLGTVTATGSTNLTFTSGGNHTLAVTATNDVGTASTSEVITIVTQTPQTSTLKVAITKPVANSTYTLTSNGCPLSIPDAFTSNSTATSGVTSLAVTFNGNPVSVTTTTLGKPSVTANGTLVVTAPGVYTLAVTATDQNGTASTSETITVVAPTPTPRITIVKPTDGAQYTVGTSACPLWVQVSVTGNTTPGSTLSTFTLTLNGQPVTYTSLTGLNTVSANGTVNLKITTTGTYTLVATTTSGGVSATDTNTFKVVPPSGCGSGWGSGWGWNNCDSSSSWGGSWGSSWNWGSWGSNSNCTPTPCNINWEQSWSCGSYQTGGKTLPFTFHIQYTGSNCTNYWNSYYKNCDSDYYNSDNDSRNCWGNYGYVNCVYGNVQSSSSCLNNTWDNINGCKYSDDTTVKVVCYEIKSNGSCSTPVVYTCNAKTNGYKISSNDQYSCNFATAKGTHTYRCDVYYTDKNSGKQCFLGSQKFYTR